MNNELVISRKASKMEYSELYPELKKVLGYAYQFCGRVPNGETEQERIAEIDVQISMLIDTLQLGDNRYLTLDEIKTAFKEGLALLSGTNYGLNNETYAKFLASFIAKKKAVPDYSLNQKILAARTEISEEEKERIHQTALAHCLAVFRETGEVQDLGNAIGRTLWKKGLIKFNKEKWAEYIKEAEGIEKLRLVNEKTILEKLGPAKSREQTYRMKDIIKELGEISSGERSVESVAAKLALRDYFKALK